MSYSIQSLANAYADRKLANQPQDPDRQVTHNRHVYDFVVTGFNVTTVASVITVALAILVGSPLGLILALLVCNVRRGFMNQVDCTAAQINNAAIAQDQIFEIVGNLNPAGRRDAIAAHLGIQDRNWNPVRLQLLNFRAWMNWTTAARVEVSIRVSEINRDRRNDNQNNYINNEMMGEFQPNVHANE